jgi:hemerythrin superfamily protein
MPNPSTRGGRTGRTGSSGAAGSAATRRAPRDVIALVKADHARVNELFRRYDRLGARAYKGRRQVADRVVKELSVHAVAEEAVLYPRVRGLAGGDTLAVEALGEHHALKALLVALDECDPVSPRFDEYMARVRDEVKRHVTREESAGGILGQLRRQLPRDELERMGQALAAAKKSAPTHPHPRAPSTHPANVLVGAATAIVDRARDALRRRR